MEETVFCFGKEWLVHHRWGWMHDKPGPRANCWYDPTAIIINENYVDLIIHRNPGVIDKNQRLVTDKWVKDGQFIPEMYLQMQAEPGSLFAAEYGTGFLCCKENTGFGTYTLTAKLPNESYVWPAFWLFQDQGSSAEIDIFEAYSKDTMYKKYKKCLFFKKRFIGWYIESCLHSDIKLKGTGVRIPDFEDFDLDPSSHVIEYKFTWTPTYMAFYLNGICYRMIMDKDVLDYFAQYNGKMYPIINNHIAGGKETKLFNGTENGSIPTMQVFKYEYKEL